MSFPHRRGGWARALVAGLASVALGLGLLFAAARCGVSIGRTQAMSAHVHPLIGMLRQVDDDLRGGHGDLARRRVEAMLAGLDSNPRRTPEAFFHEVMTLSAEAP